jgi:Rad3-related DNA helicase
MVFCPSFAYAERLHTAVLALAPELSAVLQGRTMGHADRAAFLSAFEDPDHPVLAFCVLGGIWGEGVDLAGDRLIGAIIIGVGLGTPDPLHEVMASYFHEKSENGREYAYLYPGMNRVLQAAGRVIRDEGDVGVVLLIDDRYATPFYRGLLPPHWRGLTYAGNCRSLSELLRRFWALHPKDQGGET